MLKYSCMLFNLRGEKTAFRQTCTRFGVRLLRTAIIRLGRGTYVNEYYFVSFTPKSRKSSLLYTHRHTYMCTSHRPRYVRATG